VTHIQINNFINRIKERMLILKILKNKSITDVPFFKASGVHIGVRRNKNKKDLCVIYSEKPAVGAAVFTKNIIKAAPVLLDMLHIKSDNIRAIVANSGSANACTGEKGYKDALEMAIVCAKHLNLKTEEVIVASTGVIGLALPMDIIIPGIKECCDNLSYEGGPDASEAIMTTDTFSKKITVEFELSGKICTMSGIAKGSGMIHPNMGTMLGFVVTDAAISKSLLSKALSDSVEDSYNMVSVDGDTSTNDTVVVLANGACGNNFIDKEGSDFTSFMDALNFVNKELSKQIAKDGEGATKLVEVNLYGARTKKDAKILAKSIITSSLVKAMMFGSDANLGRIFCALGYSTGEFEPMKVEISFKSEEEEITVAQDGFGLNFDEAKAKAILDRDKVNIIVKLHDGDYNATAWGCDLTYDYVKINGSYRT